MTALTTQALKLHIADQFVESLTEAANTVYYMFVGRPEEWDDENNPPDPIDSVHELAHDTYDQMVFGKLVTSSDVKLMARRYDWEANTVYARYDDDVDLANSNFFVLVNANTSYHVFKCLDNNGNAASTVEPNFAATSADDEYYATSDGYQWKYLYSIDSATFNKFATDTFIPYVPNANVSGNAVIGAIDTIIVEDAGTRYNSYANGFFQTVSVDGNPLIHAIEPTSSSNTDFYKNCSIKIVAGTGAGQQRKILEYIVSGGQKAVYLDQAFNTIPDNTSQYEIMPHVEIEGDGSGAQARAIVNPASNTISRIEITTRGSNYSWANATVQANTGVLVGNTTLIANSAVLRVVIGPPEGHGGNIPSELGIDRVGISVSFANTENGTISTHNKFRTFGLLKDPKWANVQITVSDVAGNFQDDEIVESDSGARGIVTAYNDVSSSLRLTEVSGIFTVGEVVTGLTSNASATIANTFISGFEKTFATFDQRTRMDIELNGGIEFVDNELVTQSTTSANGYVHDANATFVALTNTKGVFNTTDVDEANFLTGPSGAVANIAAIHLPDLIKGSGKILYIENTSPIQRSNTTTETIKLVIGFGS